MSQPPVSDDLSHDTHLRAALRHAPDHALAPPAGLSQTILAAARQAHRPARAAATPMPPVRITTARPRALQWLLQWWSSPRLAGALATGLVAALGLGLWIDLGREPVIERRVAAPGTGEVPGGAPPTPAAPTQAKSVRARDATVHAEPAPAAPAAKADAARTTPAPRATDSDTALRRQAPLPKSETPPASAQALERRDERGVAEVEAALAKAAAPTPAAPVVADAAPANEAAAPASPRHEASSERRMAQAAETVPAASPALTLLRRARSELAGGGARWTWQAPGTPMLVPFDDAAQAWLLRVVQSTRGRWVDVPGRAGVGEATEVRWWRDDWPHAILRIEAEGLRWIESNGRVRYAPLDAAVLQRLRLP